MSWILALVWSGFSKIVTSIFDTKKAKLEVQQQGVIGLFLALRQAGITDIAQSQVIAQIVMAEAASEHWIVAAWRPLSALVILGMVIIMFFGYTPPMMYAETLPPLFEKLLNIFMICLGGYLPLRSMDKWVNAFTKNRMVGQAIKAMSEIQLNEKNNLPSNLDYSSVGGSSSSLQSGEGITSTSQTNSDPRAI